MLLTRGNAYRESAEFYACVKNVSASLFCLPDHVGATHA